MKINILDRGFGKRHPYKRLREYIFRPYWFPVQNAWKELRDTGVSVAMFGSVRPDLFDCDVLILSSRTVDGLVDEGSADVGSRAAFCQMVKERGCRSVWFDARDSAGNCQFDVLPYVDTYLKRQIYKDRSVYRRKLYYGRLYSDYYDRERNLKDVGDTGRGSRDSDLPRDPYEPTEIASEDDDLSRMAVAWGCGAEFHWPLLRRTSWMRYFSDAAVSQGMGFRYPTPETRDPTGPRRHDFCALFDAARYTVRSVGYQRQLALDASRAHPSRTKLTGRVPRAEFYASLASSKITVSSFGWGEVCFREYEATYCGSTILMADMSNIETFPNIYDDGKTYVSYKWDMSDFAEKIDMLLRNERMRIDIAHAAQQVLLSQWTADGRENFAERFLNLIGGARK
jgi:hypothetical protein